MFAPIQTEAGFQSPEGYQIPWINPIAFTKALPERDIFYLLLSSPIHASIICPNRNSLDSILPTSRCVMPYSPMIKSKEFPQPLAYRSREDARRLLLHRRSL